jgi:hypothetical protein
LADPRFRRAVRGDLPDIVRMLADRDPNNELVERPRPEAAGVGDRTCTRKGCALVQLTSDKTRRDAIRFYESLGFVASHEGMKLSLQAGNENPETSFRQ